MTIEQLNERISQLTDLVSSASDTINNAKEMIKLAEQERDRLADQRRESELKLKRVKEYHCVQVSSVGAYNLLQEDKNDAVDNAYYYRNNYFHTAERAQEVADKINFLLKLERLHDVFCPDFNLGLGDGLDVEKYYVYYNFVHEKWMDSCVIHASHAVQVYFPTKEITQKVCDILNAELESEK